MQKFQIDVLPVVCAVLMVLSPYSCIHSQGHTLSLSVAFDFLGCCGFYFFGVVKSKVNYSVFVINTTGALLPHENSSYGVKELCTSSREPLSATLGPSHGSLNAARPGPLPIPWAGLKGGFIPS